MAVEVKETDKATASTPVQEDTDTRRWTLPALWWVVQSRPNWFVAGLLLLLSLIFMSPGLLPGRVAAPMDQLLPFEPWHSYYPDVDPPIHGGDLLSDLLPWRHWAQQEFAAGRFPLWASSPAGGMPLFASIQPSVLYPLHLLWILMPVGVGLGIIMTFKLWLTGLGMWFFLRALGLHPTASLLSALGFMFSAWFVDWLTWPLTSVYLLLPWLTWAVYAWCRQGKRPALFWLAALLSCAIFGGHPEVLFIIGVVVALWTLSLLDFRNPPSLVKQIAGLVVSGAVGFALGAIQLLPFLSVLDLTHAAAQRTDSAPFVANYLDIQMALDLILPRSWGQLGEGVFAPGVTLFTEGNGYFGLVAVLGLLLTVVAVARRSLAFRIALPWLVIGILAWLVTFDDGIGTILRGLPGLNKSINVRWVAIVGFAALVLSAFGWDWFARQSTKWVSQTRTEKWPPGRLGGAAITLLAVGLGMMAVHMAGIPHNPSMKRHDPWLIVNDDYRFYWAIWAVGVALALLGAMGLWAAAWRARWVGPLLLAVVLVLDLWRLLFTINGSAPAEKYYPWTSFLHQVKELVPPTERILAEGEGLPSNTALVYGIRDWRAQDPMLSERAHSAAVMLDPKMPKDLWTDYNMFLYHLRLPIAPILGVRYFIFPAGADPNTSSPTDTTVPTFTRLAYKDGLGLWRAEGVPGFTYLSDNVKTVENEEAASEWMKGLDWTLTRSYPAMVEATASEVTQVAQVAGVKRDPLGSSPGRTDVLEYTPGHIKIWADAKRGGLLVVSESWYPGWRATLDGEPVGVLRANYLSQGVVVPAGTHTVDLVYAPEAFQYGALLSRLGLLGLAVLGVWARKISRK